MFTICLLFQGLIIIGGEDETHPSKVRLFKNRPHMTFDQASTKGSSSEISTFLQFAFVS